MPPADAVEAMVWTGNAAIYCRRKILFISLVGAFFHGSHRAEWTDEANPASPAQLLVRRTLSKPRHPEQTKLHHHRLTCPPRHPPAKPEGQGGSKTVCVMD